MEEKKIKCKKCKREYYNLSDEPNYKSIEEFGYCVECCDRCPLFRLTATTIGKERAKISSDTQNTP